MTTTRTPRAAARANVADQAETDHVPAAADRRGATSGLAQLPKVVGAILAPTTLLSAILFYFGWSHAYWFFDYLGVNATIFDLSTRDFVQRSVDGLFVPMTVMAVAALGVLWGHANLRVRAAVTPRPRWFLLLGIALGLLGVVLAGSGLMVALGASVSWMPLHNVAGATPLALACGVGLLVYTIHLHHLGRAADPDRVTPPWVAVAAWSAVFLLVGLSLFWAAADYSAAVGVSRARQFIAELDRQPDVAVYSSRSLSLTAPGVDVTRCRDDEATYRYRYDGLHLALQSSDQYLFIPEGWSRESGVAIVIPKSDAVRLEFMPAASNRRPPAMC